MSSCLTADVRSRAVRPGRTAVCWFVFVAVGSLWTATSGIGLAGENPTLAAVSAGVNRLVLVELFTSQGCDYCPEAEHLLGGLAARNRSLVPVAFHVDYFNSAWRDPYSDRRYSERQMAYDRAYKKPKPREYGLYYTPMLMIDGAWSVNGRDRAGAEAAIQQALLLRPKVALQVWLTAVSGGGAAGLRVRLAALHPSVERRPLLVGAVVRDDGLTNLVRSGENAGKTLVARFPARQMRIDGITLEGPAPRESLFKLVPESDWRTNTLRVAVFVQDAETLVVHQTVDVPWQVRSVQAKAPQDDELERAHGAANWRNSPATDVERLGSRVISRLRPVPSSTERVSAAGDR